MKEQNFLENRGLRVKEERTRLNLSQAEVAEKCNVSRIQWGRYERNENRLDGEVLKRFGGLGADVNYILTGQRESQVKHNDNLQDYPFSGEYNQLEGTEKKLYQMAYASEWVNEAEQQNGIVFHPAFKQMLNSAVALHGLSRAGIFNLIDGLALFAKKDESIFLSMETKNPIN